MPWIYAVFTGVVLILQKNQQPSRHEVAMFTLDFYLNYAVSPPRQQLNSVAVSKLS